MFPYVIYSNKKNKNKNMGYQELVGFELTTLSCSSLQALEKVHLTPELSGPINVKDSFK